MVRLLPSHPSLEHLKHQSKDLLAAYQRGEPDAQARLHRWFQADSAPAPLGSVDSAPAEPGQRNEQTLRLHHSQLAIAREYGFPSWPRLAAWVTREELPGALATQVELLGVRSWRVIAAATNALTAAGTAGVAAAIEGLSHPNPRVRRGAAGFMDHHADDSCVEKLIELALHDPVPYVRRVAVHAVQCQRCKPAPLTKDVVPMLVRVARDDPNTRVRTEAIYALGQQRPDARIVETLTAMLREETHPGLRKVVHGALKRQSPEYRQDAARRAREANLARRR